MIYVLILNLKRNLFSFQLMFLVNPINRLTKIFISWKFHPSAVYLHHFYFFFTPIPPISNFSMYPLLPPKFKTYHLYAYMYKHIYTHTNPTKSIILCYLINQHVFGAEYWNWISEDLSLDKAPSPSLRATEYPKALHAEVGSCEINPSTLACRMVVSLCRSC